MFQFHRFRFQWWLPCLQFDSKYIHWSAKGKVIELRTWRNESFFRERKVASGVSECVVRFEWELDGENEKQERTVVLPSFALINDADWLDWRESWLNVLNKSASDDGMTKGATVYAARDFFDDDEGKVEVSLF